MLAKLLHLLLNCKTVYSNLGFSYIQEKVNEVFVNSAEKELEPLKQTIANPFFGFIADKSGFNFNIRFFSPYINAHYSKDGKREHMFDSSLEPITSIFIKFFPSPHGQLNVSSMDSLNPLNFFECDKKEFVEFFAKLFIAILEQEQNIDFNCNQLVTTNIMISQKKEFYESLKTLFFARNDNSIFKDRSIKLLLIHSYLINILDPYVQGEGDDYFKLYLTEIAKNYKSTQEVNFTCQKFSKKFLQMITNYYKSMNLFPYSLLDQPEPNRAIPSYIRQQSGSKFFKKECENSPETANIALLHICNCLFFKNDGSYTTEHLPNASKKLKDFYSKYDKLFTLNMKIRDDWAEVIRDLNKNKSDTGSIYPVDYISYSNSSNTGVNIGIINMMNVLITIAGLQDENILTNINEKNLEEKLQFLIQRLCYQGKREKNASLKDFNYRILKEFETYSAEKKDFLGSFAIEFIHCNNNYENIKVLHDEMFVDVKFIKSNHQFNVYSKEDFREIYFSDSYLDLMFDALLFPNEWIAYFKMCGIFHGKRINTNISIHNSCRKLLLSIDRLYLKNDRESNAKKEIFEKVLNLILDKVEWNDSEIKEQFSNFLCLKRCLFRENDMELVVKGYSGSLYSRSPFLCNKWDEFFSNEISEFKTLSLSCPERDIYSRTFDTNFNKTNLIIAKNIYNFDKIETLKLRGFNSNRNELLDVFEDLRNPKDLQNLILTGNKGLIISFNLNYYENLKFIDLSYCDLSEIPNGLHELKNLEEINLKGNKFIIDPVEFSKHFPKLKNLIL